MRYKIGDNYVTRSEFISHLGISEFQFKRIYEDKKTFGSRWDHLGFYH